MAKVIVAFIIFTFAIFGVDAIIGFSSSETEVASVNGTGISSAELARTAELLRRQSADPTVDEEALKRQALNSLIARQLLIQDAESLNLHVADSRVDREILRAPQFQVEGVFEKALFENAVRNVGLSPLAYRGQLASDLLFQQQRLGIAASAFLTSQELEALVSLGEQTRDAAYLTIDAAALGEGLGFSTEQLRDYYTENIDQFTTAESVSVEYLELKVEDFYDRVEVEDLEVQQRFQQELESVADLEERRAAHILVTVAEGQDKADARRKLEELQQQLQGGADFSELAKAHSDDPGSAQAGGDLGFSPRGSFVPEFEEVLYQLAENEVSGIVETDFGFHLIKLLEIKTSEPPTLAERKDALEQEIRHNKAEQLFVAAVEELQNDSFSAGDLAEPAANAGLKIQVSELFTREGGTSGVTANSAVVKTAFSDPVLQERLNSDVIELTPDHVVVLRVKEHQPARPMEFAEVTDRIEEALVAAASRSKALELGQQLLADLRTGNKTAETIASETGYEWTRVNGVTRNQPEMDSELVTTLFRMPKPDAGEPTYAGVARSDGDYVVMSLTAVNTRETDISPRQLASVRQALAGQFGSMDFTEYQRSLQEQAEIVTY